MMTRHRSEPSLQSMSTDDHKWKVMLDAAAYAPTQPLDLTEFPADFVAVSFYKLFGFPTGLGALLVCSCLAVA
jgi:molybdenum cofactor sulfurtransferase